QLLRHAKPLSGIVAELPSRTSAPAPAKDNIASAWSAQPRCWSLSSQRWLGVSRAEDSPTISLSGERRHVARVGALGDSGGCDPWNHRGGYLTQRPSRLQRISQA